MVLLHFDVSAIAFEILFVKALIMRVFFFLIKQLDVEVWPFIILIFDDMRKFRVF